MDQLNIEENKQVEINNIEFESIKKFLGYHGYIYKKNIGQGSFGVVMLA